MNELCSLENENSGMVVRSSTLPTINQLHHCHTLHHIFRLSNNNMHSILVHRTNLIILLLNNNNNLNTNRTTSSKYNGSTSRSNSIINYINSGTDYLWTMLVPITPVTTPLRIHPLLILRKSMV
jgi:hypothetical protein